MEKSRESLRTLFADEKNKIEAKYSNKLNQNGMKYTLKNLPKI